MLSDGGGRRQRRLVQLVRMGLNLCEIPGGADADRHRLSEDDIVEAKHCLQDASEIEMTLATHDLYVQIDTKCTTSE